MVLINRIEAATDPLPDAVELFWTFFNDGMDPEAFATRMQGLRETLAEGAGEYLDPEIDAVMRWAGEDPPAAAELVIEKLDALAESLRPAYVPDQRDDPVALLAALHLDTARLYRALRDQGYSEDAHHLMRVVTNLDDRTMLVFGGLPIGAFESFFALRSLIFRVKAEFSATWDSDYGSALQQMAEALG